MREIHVRSAIVAGCLVAAVVLLPSGGCRKWDNPFDPKVNSPPTNPTDPSPPDSFDVADTSVTLTWEASDPDGDPLTYDLYLDTDSAPQQLTAGLLLATYKPGRLDTSRTYYWLVVARDSHNVPNESSAVWRFSTRPGNRSPLTPSDPSPGTGAQNQPARLSLTWQCADPDSGDTVTYDVYLGTDTVPQRVSQNQNARNYATPALLKGQHYYWRVVARDNHLNESSGPLWSFTTVSNHAPATPSNPTPPDSATGQPVRPTFGWTCSDPDSGDVLKYDLYLGFAEPLPRVALDLTTASYRPFSPLLDDTIYRWKVIAKDNYGGETEGPVWTLRTQVSFKVVSPDSLSRWRVLDTQTVIWSGGPDSTVADSTVLHYSTNEGATWSRLGRAALPDRYDWFVPWPAQLSARIQVRVHVDADSSVAMSSRFVTYDTLQPTLLVIANPDSNSVWYIDSTYNITWTGGVDGMDSTQVFYSTDGGLHWVRQGVTNQPGKFSWTVIGPATDEARFQLKAWCLSRVVVVNSKRFRVVAP